MSANLEFKFAHCDVCDAETEHHRAPGFLLSGTALSGTAMSRPPWTCCNAPHTAPLAHSPEARHLLLTARLDTVREHIQREADKLATVLGDDSRMVSVLRDQAAELSECVRMGS